MSRISGTREKRVELFRQGASISKHAEAMPVEKLEVRIVATDFAPELSDAKATRMNIRIVKEHDCATMRVSAANFQNRALRRRRND